MIEVPGVRIRYREDEVTRQQVRPGTARRVWPYLRRYRGPSGAGKTTITHLVPRLYDPVRGAEALATGTGPWIPVAAPRHSQIR